ncbi:MAG: AsnC family transcriptional regulator [Actinobacteria bacterium]|nr:AsnC family transcriptional regulator [Actinomycetota bacterium]
MYLDSVDKKILNLVQTQFPLTSEPYADLGASLGIDANEVICRIEQLKVMGIIRQISPILDSRRLGYQTTLVAMRVEPEKLHRAGQVIAEHKGVSHGYERDHLFNLWFTLALPPEVDIEAELQQLNSAMGARALFALPAVKLFKIGAYFDMDEDGQETAGISTWSSGILSEKVSLFQHDKLIIRELQQDLPLNPMPFSRMATRLGMNVEDFLAGCQSLLQRGIMRRFGAAINHRRVGFRANAMACWIVPSDMVVAAGQALASLQEVSHCYERKTNLLWQYNLFAMVHGRSREVCQEIADNVSHRLGLKDYVLLFSLKEFKKTRVKYLV